MMSREALTGLIAAAEGAGIRFISDEIYHGLDYAFPAVTAAELSPHALVINSFSKYFCMTGWRVGWMVVPGAAGAADRTAAAESVDLGADAVADRGRSGVRGPRGDGGGQARLPGEPPHPDRGPAAGRARPNSCPPTARSTSTPTCRNSPPTVSPLPARCWRRPMSRRPPGVDFDPVHGRALHPVFLCAFGRGNARSGRAHRALAGDSALPFAKRPARRDAFAAEQDRPAPLTPVTCN